MTDDFFIREEGSFASDSLRASAFEEEACIQITSPLAGDTEHGFGESASFTLSKDQAVALAAWLMAWSAAADGAPKP